MNPGFRDGDPWLQPHSHNQDVNLWRGYITLGDQLGGINLLVPFHPPPVPHAHDALGPDPILVLGL